MEMRGLTEEEARSQLSLESQIRGFRKQLLLLAHRACQGRGTQEGAVPSSSFSMESILCVTSSWRDSTCVSRLNCHWCWELSIPSPPLSSSFRAGAASGRTFLETQSFTWGCKSIRVTGQSSSQSFSNQPVLAATWEPSHSLNSPNCYLPAFLLLFQALGRSRPAVPITTTSGPRRPLARRLPSCFPMNAPVPKAWSRPHRTTSRNLGSE